MASSVTITNKISRRENPSEEAFSTHQVVGALVAVGRGGDESDAARDDQPSVEYSVCRLVLDDLHVLLAKSVQDLHHSGGRRASLFVSGKRIHERQKARDASLEGGRRQASPVESRDWYIRW